MIEEGLVMNLSVIVQKLSKDMANPLLVRYCNLKLYSKMCSGFLKTFQALGKNKKRSYLTAIS